MRPSAAVLLLSIALAVGCEDASPAKPTGTNLGFVIRGQTEFMVCGASTSQATCLVTLTARVELVELEGKTWQVVSVKGTVRDSRSGQDLNAVPGTLSSEDVEVLAGSNVLRPNGRLTIPLQLRFVSGSEPGVSHELIVAVVGNAIS